ncbi:MAG: hypothetical protein IKH88_12720 [Prevotella sp.]|nr:hypothetical protein [Prevotella sp.]
MDEIIKIKCPNCKSVLATKNKPGLEKKSITCPMCKQKNPFNKYIPNSFPQKEEKEKEREIIEKIKIKCPACNTVLEERMRPGLSQATITCPMCRNRAPFHKYNDIETRGITISPETGMVEIIFIPQNRDDESFPFAGTYRSFITPKSIIPNIIPKASILPMVDYPRFLEKLTHLLNLYVRKVPYYYEFDTAYIHPATLEIVLYDKDLNVYEMLLKYGNFEGNIRFDVDGNNDAEFTEILEKDIRRFIPQIDKFIIGPDFVSPDDSFATYSSFNIKPLEIKKMIDQYVEEQESFSYDPTSYGPPPINDSNDHGEWT